MFQLIIKQKVIQYNVVLTIDRIKLFKYIFYFLLQKKKKCGNIFGQEKYV